MLAVGSAALGRGKLITRAFHTHPASLVVEKGKKINAAKSGQGRRRSKRRPEGEQQLAV